MWSLGFTNHEIEFCWKTRESKSQAITSRNAYEMFSSHHSVKPILTM